MYCKDCKHWIRHVDTEVTTRHPWMAKFGGCTSEKFVDSNETEYAGKNLIPAPDMLVTYDYESYASDCEMGEDFGCVHFEEGKYERPVVSKDEIDAFIEGAKSY